MKRILIMSGILLWSALAAAEEIKVPYVKLENDFFAKPDPKAQEWNTIETTNISMLPQNITMPSLKEATIKNLSIQTLHNNKWIAIKLVWKDPTKNVHVESSEASDACAVQFPFGEAAKTSPFMGNKGAMVAILHWKGIWQNDIEKGYQQVKDLHPNTWVDTYRFGIQAAIDKKNPIAQPDRKTPVEELFAEGFGTLTTQPKQNATGSGVWENGEWNVVLARPLKSGDKNDPPLKAGSQTSLAFALWDGAAQNVGSRKNYAPWVPLILEKNR